MFFLVVIVFVVDSLKYLHALYLWGFVHGLYCNQIIIQHVIQKQFIYLFICLLRLDIHNCLVFLVLVAMRGISHWKP